MAEIEFTEAEATDEAVLLFVRKMRRLHPEAYADVMGKLPEGAPWALERAQQRADKLRADDVLRSYPDPSADDDEDEDAQAAGCVYHRDHPEACSAPEAGHYRVSGDVWCAEALRNFAAEMGQNDPAVTGAIKIGG